ncbi:hypothetical protein COY87_04695 [Candidatus Roizmanbacteria bacterium CG_4_10_14_0_8_um_filter_33_9]|uniref:Metallo-beta-lactamase domain-containing protein n=1 Tax=Candidatus Roizmanbacteria bacterium CG_4_10_14_0_8_um_filter_33_9 TaxID=1974826 RepID=A0A2M7QHC4_9BACT|nr:MAG: hypothetical protein COY87_04695 [Candidatus Roizmanbacteria bacterium CG_4_10_14_0_8_um_filter_33_9]
MADYKVRFVPLGGVVGVTKNMYLYEIYKNTGEQENYDLQDIFIIDCGIGFPLEKELGVDFVIPDISYLKDKKDKIRAIFLSHGHEDHTSALPYHYNDLGRPPIFASKLTAAFVENKFREFSDGVKVTQINYTKEYRFGDFTIKCIPVTHSIPDTMHILIKTPVGSFYHGTDFKLDLTPPYGKSPDFYEITKAGHDGILCLLSDCLGAEREGLTLSEAIVGETFENVMRKTKGKFIMTTFSSNISRIRQCVEAAIKFNRKIIFLGRSMKENTRIAQDINYLPIPFSLIGKEEEVMKLPPNKVCLIVAGSQGQYGSALSKIANKMNKNVAIKPGDTIIFSSDPIPGNENEVYAVIEELTLKGAEVIYSDIQDQLHASGHGNKEDLKYLIRFTNPQYFIPIGGTVRHQQQYRRIVGELGFDEKKVFMLQEGETVWFTKGNTTKGEIVETKNIYVDAYGIGDVGQTILRERKSLSSDGIVVIVLAIDKAGSIMTSPRLLSKGFVFEKAQGKLFDSALRLLLAKKNTDNGKITDITAVKRKTIGLLEDFFYKETGRKPLIIVEVIQV